MKAKDPSVHRIARVSPGVKRARGAAIINPTLLHPLPPSRLPGEAAAAAAASTATAGYQDGKIPNTSAPLVLFLSISASVRMSLAFGWVDLFADEGPA